MIGTLSINHETMLVPGQNENVWHNCRVSWSDWNREHFCQVPSIVVGPNESGSTAGGSVTWCIDERDSSAAAIVEALF